MGRRFTLTLEAKGGHIHDFSATVGERLAISGDGTMARTFTCDDLPDTPVVVRIWTTGVPGATYTITVDLPGRVNDFTWKYTLASTIQGVEFHV